MVTNKVWIHPRGLVGAPCKYIDIFYKEVYQLFLLPRRQLNFDLEEFLPIVANDNSFQLLAFCPSYLYLYGQH